MLKIITKFQMNALFGKKNIYSTFLWRRIPQVGNSIHFSADFRPSTIFRDLPRKHTIAFRYC